MENTKAAKNCCGSDRIGRRDNCAKRKSSRPRKRRQDRMCNPRDSDRCHQHKSYCQEKNRPQIPAEIAPRCEQRSGIKKCRENEIEYGVRIEFHLRQSRHETQGKSANDEYDRVRQRNFAREHSENRHQSEQKDNDLSLVHDQLSKRWSSRVTGRWNSTSPAPQYTVTPLRH